MALFHLAMNPNKGLNGEFLPCKLTLKMEQIISYQAERTQRWLKIGSYKDASVAAQNDCFGAQFGVLRQPLRLAAAAAAIEKAQ